MVGWWTTRFSRIGTSASLASLAPDWSGHRVRRRKESGRALAPPRTADQPARDSFARRHRFAVGLLAGVLLAGLALVIVGLATGPTNGTQTTTGTSGSSRRYAAAANVLCAAALSDLERLGTDEHLARADAIAGKISPAALAARYRADLLAIGASGHRTANQVAALPAPGSDAKLLRLVAGMRQWADVAVSEGRAAGRGDQTAVKAYAAQANRLIDANARLARAVGAPDCVL